MYKMCAMCREVAAFMRCRNVNECSRNDSLNFDFFNAQTAESPDQFLTGGSWWEMHARKATARWQLLHVNAWRKSCLNVVVNPHAKCKYTLRYRAYRFKCSSQIKHREMLSLRCKYWSKSRNAGKDHSSASWKYKSCHSVRKQQRRITDANLRNENQTVMLVALIAK